MKRFLPLLILLLTSVSIKAAPSESPFATLSHPMPAGAVALFDGTNLDAWRTDQDGQPGWAVANGALLCSPGGTALATKQSFADCQLHYEWRPAAAVTPEVLPNSVLFQSRYEAPMPVSSDGAPGAWQSVDITYRAPRFNNDGSLKSSAFVTVHRNGRLERDRFELAGSTISGGRPRYEKHSFKEPLVLQAGKFPVSFRNIWIRELGVQQLFNGKDTGGWYSFLDKLGKNQDPEGNFTITNGLLHVEGKNFGYLATEQAFANYYLKVVFKWGQHQYAPRATGKRDSGILYHFGADVPDKVWPKSLECQVQEGDCGDYWCVDGALIDSPNHTATEWAMRRIYRTADFENPCGEWNTIEIVCNGNQSEHYVNGHLVNTGTKANVSAGKILLQSEGAEIFYKTVELIPY